MRLVWRAFFWLTDLAAFLGGLVWGYGLFTGAFSEN